MKQFYMILAVALMCAVTTSRIQAAQQSSVSRVAGGTTITFTFDKAYEVGTFVNGDWWVVGPVNITDITPAGGAMSNPTLRDQQGLLSKWGNYVASMDIMTQLPYTARAGESIIKAVQKIDGCKGYGPRMVGECAGSFDVLTVLGSTPPDNGSTVFRPPYAGTNKPLRSIDNVVWERLPRIQAISDNRYQRTFADIVTQWTVPTMDMVRDGGLEIMRALTAIDVLGDDYAASIADNYATSVLSTFGTEPDSEKAAAVYALLQPGFDNYEVYSLGIKFSSGAGQHLGKKPQIVFAAALYDEPAMLAGIRSAAAKAEEGWFQEDKQVYTTVNSVTPVWGDGGNDMDAEHVRNYWLRFGYDNTDNNKATGDPYGYIDGPAHGIHGSSYQWCCSTGPFMGFVFAQHLMPWMRYANNDWEIVEYIDRVWNGRGFDNFDGGWWGSPDPCAPKDGTEGVDYGTDPSNPSDCIKNGTGRFTADHGTKVTMNRLSWMTHGLFDTFRDCADPDHPSYPCTGLGAPVNTDDTTSPTVLSVTAPSAATLVFVTFSEPVDAATAALAGNYSIDNDITVSGAALGTDNRTVTLTVSTMSVLTGYALTVSGVKDKAAPANTMVTTQKPFTFLGQAGEMIVQAEDMTLDANLQIEERTGRNMIAVKSSEPVPSTGNATYVFSGISGVYDVVVSVAPENDGQPGIKLHVDGTVVLEESFPTQPGWTNPAMTQHDYELSNVSINNGDIIRLELTSDGTATAAAFARTDWIKFIFKAADVTTPMLSAEKWLGNVSVSPSPVTARAMLRLPVKADSPVRITDCRGQLVAKISSVPGSRLHVWDGRKAVAGLYLYSFEYRGITYFGKFVKAE